MDENKLNLENNKYKWFMSFYSESQYDLKHQIKCLVEHIK